MSLPVDEFLRRFLLHLQPEAEREGCGSLPVGEEAEVADANEAARKPQPRIDTVLSHAHPVCVLSTLYHPCLALTARSDNVPKLLHHHKHVDQEISPHSNLWPTAHQNQLRPIQRP
jgi:hypothetical protein